MLIYHCPHCKTEYTPDQARAQLYRCPRCAAFLLARAVTPASVPAVPPTLPAAPGRRQAGEGATSTGTAPTAPPVRSLDDLRADLQRQLAAGRAIPASNPPPTPAASPAQPSNAPSTSQPDSPALSACLVLPPTENEKDAATMEQMLSTLGQLPSPVAFEIAADDKERKLILRGEPEALRRVKRQLYAAYERSEIEDLPPQDDPARTGATGGAVWLSVRLHPARAEFLPLKIWREFKEQEPLCALLGAFSGLAVGEAALSQVIVRDPAPNQWADPHLQQLAALQRKGYGAELPAPARNFAGLLGATVCFILLAAVGLWAFLDYWPRMLFAAPVCFGLGYLGLRLLGLSRNPWVTSLDEPAKEKLSESALLVEVRLFAAAATRGRAQEILDQLLAAYRLFNTVSGNHFEATPLSDSVRPANFAAPLPARRAKPPTILSVKETAGLWHLPVLTALELVKRQAYERVLPRPDDVADPVGAPIGVSRKGDRAIPVALNRSALDANTFIVGMTQMGKSNLMGQIAVHLAGDRDRALIVVDPHGDLVRCLTGLMPSGRRADILYLDFTDTERSAGLNLLDVSDGTDPHTIAESFIDIGRALWADYWGPRMVVPLINSLKALAYANTGRPPERQFTILALSTLLTCDPEWREAFLNREVPETVAPTVHRYFKGQFNDSSNSFREQVLSPVLSKANAFERSPIILRLIGQPRSTVRLFEAIQSRKIILVNTASGTLGSDLAGFLGSLFVNMMRLVIARQEQLPVGQRIRVSLIADEFQTMQGVNWGALLGELQKFGGSFILGTQALGNLLEDQTNRALVESIFAGARTTIALGTNGADAYYLTKHQLGAEQLRPASLMDLPRGVAYVKTLDPGGRPIPAYSVNINALPPADPEAERQVLARRSAYTVPAAEADRLYRLSLAMLDEYARPGVHTPDVVRALEALEAASAAAPAAPGDPDTDEPVTVTPTRALRGVEIPHDLQGRSAAHRAAPPSAAPLPDMDSEDGLPEVEPPDEAPSGAEDEATTPAVSRPAPAPSAPADAPQSHVSPGLNGGVPAAPLATDAAGLAGFTRRHKIVIGRPANTSSRSA